MLCGVLLVGPGCATGPLSQRERGSGEPAVIGVASAPPVPPQAPPARPFGAVEGAAAGAAAGFSYAVLLNLLACALIVPLAPVGCAALVPELAAYTVAGAVAGAASAEPPPTARLVNEARSSVARALTEPGVQAAFRNHVVEHGRRKFRHRFVDLPDGAPSGDVDVVLEVGIARIDVIPEFQAPLLALAMEARASLIDRRNGARIASRRYRFTSETRHIAAWGENNSRLLRAAIERGSGNLAERIAGDLLRER